MIIRQEDGQAPIIKTEIDMNDIDFLYSNEKGKTIPVERTLKEVVNEAFETVEKLKNRLEDEVEILKKLSLYDGDTKGLVKWFINRKANQEGNTSTEMMEKHYNADWDENDTKH